MIDIHVGQKFAATMVSGTKTGPLTALASPDENGWLKCETASNGDPVVAELSKMANDAATIWVNLNQVSLVAIVK